MLELQIRQEKYPLSFQLKCQEDVQRCRLSSCFCHLKALQIGPVFGSPNVLQKNYPESPATMLPSRYALNLCACKNIIYIVKQFTNHCNAWFQHVHCLCHTGAHQVCGPFLESQNHEGTLFSGVWSRRYMLLPIQGILKNTGATLCPLLLQGPCFEGCFFGSVKNTAYSHNIQYIQHHSTNSPLATGRSSGTVLYS